MEKLSAQVQMLGVFCLTIGSVSITDRQQQAKKPWNILQYLIYYHSRRIPSRELVDIIWSGNSHVNPSNALKTLIFRTRKLLEPFDLPPQQIISQNQGSYYWNDEISLSLDVFEFESLCKAGGAPGLSPEEQLKLLSQALSLYKGDFLPKSAWEPWIIPISRHYQNLYTQAVLQVIRLFLAKEQWDPMADLCRRAVSINALNEDFQYYLIYALYRSGRQQQALTQYRTMADTFYNEFAITPSGRMGSLYKIIQDQKHGVNPDLSLIQKSMEEHHFLSGAYCCEFTVFRHIYQIEKRAIARSGDSVFLGLLTLSEEDGSLPKTAVLARAMRHLSNSVCSSLRRGDVYTRYSVSQYMVLLPSASFENGEMVMQRIIRNYRKTYLRKDLTVSYSVQSVLPAACSGHTKEHSDLPNDLEIFKRSLS